MKVSDIPEIAVDETPDKVIVTVTGDSGAKKLRRADPSQVGAVGPTGANGADGAPGATGADGGDGSLKFIARVQQFIGGTLDIKIIFNTLGELTWNVDSPGVISITRDGGWPGDGRTTNFIGQESSSPGTELFQLTRAGTSAMHLTHCTFNPATPGFELTEAFNEVSISISVFPES